jgi:hypothetical protein
MPPLGSRTRGTSTNVDGRKPAYRRSNNSAVDFSQGYPARICSVYRTVIRFFFGSVIWSASSDKKSTIFWSRLVR